MQLDRVIAVRNSKTIYHDGDQCVKVFGNGYSLSDVLGEAMNQSLMAECGLRVPAVREVCQINDRWTIVSEYVRGLTLAQEMQAYPERRDDCFRLMAALQRTIHQRRCARLPQLKEKLAARIARADIAPAMRESFLARLACLPGGECICHGEFKPSNVIREPDGALCILDWHRAARGDGAADVAQAYVAFLLKDEPENAERYIACFAREAGTTEGEIRAWIPVVAAAGMALGNARERRTLHDRILKNS